MDVLKKHYETFTILGGMVALLVTSCMWLNGKFGEMNDKINDVNVRLTRIETVIFMKGLMSSEMAVKTPEKKDIGG